MGNGLILQLRRSAQIYDSKEDAISVANTLSTDSNIYDGEPRLIRYQNSDGDVNALLCMKNNLDGENETVYYTVLDNEAKVNDLEIEIKTKSLTLDYSDINNTLQIVNMHDSSIALCKVKLFNVSKLMLTTNSVVKEEVTSDNINTFVVNADDIMTWDIERVNDNDIASVSISYYLL